MCLTKKFTQGEQDEKNIHHGWKYVMLFLYATNWLNKEKIYDIIIVNFLFDSDLSLVVLF